MREGGRRREREEGMEGKERNERGREKAEGGEAMRGGEGLSDLMELCRAKRSLKCCHPDIAKSPLVISIVNSHPWPK